MQNLVRSEVFRSRKRLQTWIMVGITLALDLFLYVGLLIAHFVRPHAQGTIDALRLSHIYDSGLVVVSIIGTIITVVYGSSLIGSEFSWNTLRPVLARSPKRSDLLSAKWITIVIYLLFVAAVSILLTVIMSIASMLIIGEPTGATGSLLIDVVATIARFTAGFLPYAALAMFIALLMRSNAAGIAIGIALVFVEPIVFALLGALSDTFDTIEKGGISWNQNRLMTLGGDNDIVARDAWVSAGVLAVWIAVFVGISYWIFNRRDVTSG